MPEVHNTGRVVAEWAAKAEEDPKPAAHTLKLRRSCPTATVCFDAQQSVEKYLKPYLVYRGVPVPNSHDIEELVTRLPHQARPACAPAPSLAAAAVLRRTPNRPRPT
jgi:HEPN domain-containing protein